MAQSQRINAMVRFCHTNPLFPLLSSRPFFLPLRASFFFLSLRASEGGETIPSYQSNPSLTNENNRSSPTGIAKAFQKDTRL